MTQRTIRFGTSVSTAAADAARSISLAVQADRQGLDLVTVSDHPYFGARLDAYSIIGVALGATSRISGLVSVTNLPSRPAPMLSRTVTSLSTLSGGRIVLGMGAGGLWDDIAKLGIAKLTPGAAVRAMAEGMRLVRLLSGGGTPVSFEGEFYSVHDLEPAAAPAPPIWTGAVGPKSLAVTGELADGWIPGHAADWLSDRFRESRPIIDAAAEAAGRSPADVATVYNLPGRITAEPLPRTRDEQGRWIGGSVRQWIDELTDAVVHHDAAGFVLFAPGGAEPDPDTLSRWAEEIVPAVREAIDVPSAS
ncbi:LLM class flavin-dependent oxidoreductase [Nocardia sp. NEAU-G5]|uniref:LLM class flavin-dependent oxidoreductase n=1 Tax=Nocardia albiluteola TaxID=2842303 RepID=A0ABS6AUI5_9NOCA|nr:LLM class flavin-dependent oxidoreductase [Nocardia albiluteola]MBU3060704.1 LLM class flavin-dependent oxidoreductase [Nocardia albiluteola]